MEEEQYHCMLWDIVCIPVAEFPVGNSFLKKENLIESVIIPHGALCGAEFGQSPAEILSLPHIQPAPWVSRDQATVPGQSVVIRLAGLVSLPELGSKCSNLVHYELLELLSSEESLECAMQIA